MWLAMVHESMKMCSCPHTHTHTNIFVCKNVEIFNFNFSQRTKFCDGKQRIFWNV